MACVASAARSESTQEPSNMLASLVVVLLLQLICGAHANGALAAQRKAIAENPGSSYILISFPTPEYDLSIEMVDDGAMVFFHLCTVRAAAGERAAVRLMYRLLLDGARRSELEQYGDVPSHLRKQLTAEFGVDPRGVSDDERPMGEFPSEEEYERALTVLFPDRAKQNALRSNWRAKMIRAQALAAAAGDLPGGGKDEV